jgi:hypothetical protein
MVGPAFAVISRLVAFGAATKQVEAYAVEENDRWIVITVLVKFF